jgi:hypothetical protein
MRLLVLGLLLGCGLLAWPGCTTTSGDRARAEQARTAAQAQEAGDPRSRAQIVTVVGQVRHRVIPWEQGLTLTRALDAAAYTGFTDPRSILLRRGMDFVEIKVSDLLRGTVNPDLEPGDIIEIKR